MMKPSMGLWWIVWGDLMWVFFSAGCKETLLHLYEELSYCEKQW